MAIGPSIGRQYSAWEAACRPPASVSAAPVAFGFLRLLPSSPPCRIDHCFRFFPRSFGRSRFVVSVLSISFMLSTVSCCYYTSSEPLLVVFDIVSLSSTTSVGRRNRGINSNCLPCLLNWWPSAITLGTNADFRSSFIAALKHIDVCMRWRQYY